MTLWWPIACDASVHSNWSTRQEPFRFLSVLLSSASPLCLCGLRTTRDFPLGLAFSFVLRGGHMPTRQAIAPLGRLSGVAGDLCAPPRPPPDQTLHCREFFSQFSFPFPYPYPFRFISFQMGTPGLEIDRPASRRILSSLLGSFFSPPPSAVGKTRDY